MASLSNSIEILPFIPVMSRFKYYTSIRLPGVLQATTRPCSFISTLFLVALTPAYSFVCNLLVHVFNASMAPALACLQHGHFYFTRTTKRIKNRSLHSRGKGDPPRCDPAF